jgi:hypothetical protein
MKPKTQVIKTKLVNWDYMKVKVFYTAIEAVNKMKRQFIQWERLFTNYLSYNDLIFKICKGFLQLNCKTQKIGIVSPKKT